MKKLIFLLSVSLLFLMIGRTSAQIVLPEVTITGTAKNVPAKVDQAFKSTFTDAQDPRWYQANKNYLVKFITNDMKNNALFRKNGSIVYNISYGYEKDLPASVKSLVNERYSTYNIVVAINVKQDQRDVWVVNLEDDKRNITVRVEDGELNEAARSRKLR